MQAGPLLLRIDARSADKTPLPSMPRCRPRARSSTWPRANTAATEAALARITSAGATLDRAETEVLPPARQSANRPGGRRAPYLKPALHVVQAPYAASVVAGVPVALGDMAMPDAPCSLYDPRNCA